VNAHHQNGKAEKRIRDLQDQARTSIIYAKQRWPMAISVNLWPYALRISNDARNSLPRLRDNQSPIELFSQSTIKPSVNDLHHFGCPVYVLHNRLQVKQKIDKWKPRSKLGIYLGASPRHARNIALVLNPTTGLVSPQFHCKFDELFATVKDSNDIGHSEWKQCAGFLKASLVEQLPRSDQDISTSQSYNTAWTNEFQKQGMHAVDQEVKESSLRTGPQHQEMSTQSMKLGTSDLLGISDEPHNMQQPTDEPREVHQQLGTSGSLGISDEPHNASGHNTTNNNNTYHAYEHKTTLRHSKRTHKPTQRYLESLEQETIALPAALEASRFDPYIIPEVDTMDAIMMLSKSGDPDTMYYHEALKQSDRDQFIKAMKLEIQCHENRNHWKLIHKSEVSTDQKILPAIWSMKRKRRLETGEIYKWKSRLNIHGGKQEYGINYWDTYAPVVTWKTVRLILTLMIIFKWKARQIDFVLAYP
jgi:hypothetical protein